MKVAALDLGTNTFILLIAEVENGAITKVLHDEVRVVRLGQGVHEARKFHIDALNRADEAFREFGETIKKHKVQHTLACATSAARDVTNGHQLVALAALYDIPVEIITGEQEADYTFSGTVSGSGTSGPCVIIDVGGGSTELIAGDDRGILARKSVDVGSVRLTEMFVTRHPIPVGDMNRMRDYIEERIQAGRAALPAIFAANTKFIAVAGTPTTLATVDQGLPFESERVDGYTLSLSKLDDWVNKLASITVEERQKLAGMEPKRADVIPAGAMVLSCAAKALGAKELVVSVRGLRYGVARALGARYK